MRIVYLSDHAGKLLQEAKDRRSQAEFGVGAAETKAMWAGERRREARANRPRWRKLLGRAGGDEQTLASLHEEAQREIAGAHSVHDVADGEVQRLAAGVEGERRLVSELAGVLSDEWVACCGYRNRRGETDVVLVGPAGVWAIEVKGHSGRLYAVGDDWRIVKYDNWGNQREERKATDARGRPWAQQVNDVADDLTAWLERNGQAIPIRRAVLQMIDSGSVARVENPGVDLVADRTQPLLDAVADRATPLSPRSCKEIERLVRRDHRHHNDPRPSS